MYPPATALAALNREAREATSLAGLHIPASTKCFLNVTALHNDPKNFPEPEVFRPERFLEGSPGAMQHHPYSYIPFGLGPRKVLLPTTS